MTTTTQNEYTKNMQLLTRVLNQWEQRLDHFEAQKEFIESDTEEKFHNRIDTLRDDLNHLQVRLRAMREGEPKEWFEGRDDLREGMENVKKMLEYLADQLGPLTDNENPDWQEEFSEELNFDTAVWAARIHHHPMTEHRL